MEIKYFKQGNFGDCYTTGDSYMNLVVLGKDSTFLMADDENCFEGMYKVLQITNSDYELMIEASKSKNRQKVIGIVKKIHELEDNKKILNEQIFKEKISILTKEVNPNISIALMRDFKNQRPILK